jgi:hypothetical protein
VFEGVGREAWRPSFTITDRVAKDEKILFAALPVLALSAAPAFAQTNTLTGGFGLGRFRH